MNEEKAIAKMEKAVAKKKSGVVIDCMKKADSELLIKAFEALGKIGDEDACNHITHYLDHEDKEVRIAACRAGLAIDTEYMKTRVRHQMSQETDPGVKQRIQEIFNQAAH